MIIKSITVFGILNVKEKKHHEFVYNNESGFNELASNTIKDDIFLTAFSLIFDLKYDSHFNFSNLINSQCNGESYVEILLCHKEDDDLSQYSWLLTKELKLKRLLQHPKNIFINKKRYDINIFHEALKNLGFFSIHNLNIHQLLDYEVARLSHFTRDDYWNMLMKMIHYEELIDMAERKHGVVKKQVMKRSFTNIVETVAKEIPKKTKLRNEIYERMQINRNFFSLFYIINERRKTILESQTETLQQKIDEIENVLKDNNFENHKNEKVFLLNQQKFMIAGNHIKTLWDILFEMKMKIYDYICEGEFMQKYPVTDLMDQYLSINKSLIMDDWIDDTKDLALEAKYKATVWKLNIKELINNESSDKYRKNLALLTEAFEELDESMMEYQDYKSSAFDESTYDIDSSVRYKSEENFLQKTLKLNNDIECSAQKSDEILKIIYELNSDIDDSDEDFQTLLEIEKIIQQDKEIQAEYLGPAFQYFEVNSNLDVQMWKQISPIPNIIIFTTKSSMEKFIELATDASISLTTCSIDEYSVEPYLEEIHNNKIFISMDGLISKKLKSVKLRNVLLTFLYKFLLIDDSEGYNEEKDFDEFSITDYNKVFLVTTFEQQALFSNELSNFYLHIGKGPAKIMQEMYENIKELASLECKIIANNRLKIELKEITENTREDLIAKYSQAISEVYKLKAKKNSVKTKTFITALSTNLRELLSMESDEYDKWDVIALSESLIEMCKDYPVYFYDSYEYFLERSDSDCSEMIKKDIFDIFLQSYELFKIDVYEEMKEYDVVKQFKEESKKYELLIKDQVQIINEIEKHEIILENSLSNREDERNIGKYCDMKNTINSMIKALSNSLEEINENATLYFNQSVYNDFHNQNLDAIYNEIRGAYEELMEKNKRKKINLKALNMDTYKKLVDSIQKVKQFSEKDVFIPIKVKRRAFPLMNNIVIEMLKDTVHNFTITYNSIMAEFIEYSSLFFYTKSIISEISDDNFTWNSFDITRLKSIDFVEKWKDNRHKVEISHCQRIKSLLLILHIINYISVFKFIIIGEAMFNNMEKPLERKLREFLSAISPYVQVILYEDNKNQEVMEIDNEEIASHLSF